MTYKTLIPAVMLASVVTFAAQAQEPAGSGDSSGYVERIAFSLADLSSDEGISGLQARIRKVARRLCGQAGDPTRFYAGKTCSAKASQDAFTQLDRIAARWRSGDLAAGPSAIIMRAR